MARVALSCGGNRYSLLDMVLRHSIPQRIAGHLQEAAGFGDVARCFVECFFQQPFLHLLKRQAEGQERGIGLMA